MTKENETYQKFWLNLLPRPMKQFVDGQRVERLENCRILDEILIECRRKSQEARLQLEDVPAGIRMLKYFGWRNIREPNCQREEHAVWSCRAVSLGCGANLSELRTCFHELPEKTSILETTETAYEPKSASQNDFPCRKVQERLGKCVATNLRDLANSVAEAKSSKE